MVPLSVRIPITVERVEMTNFIKKFVGTSSNTSSKINMFQKEWKPNTTSENKIVSTHPPLEEIKIKAQGVEIIASPFKHISSNEDENRNTKLKDIKGIQQQNNFTNQMLGTISSQLNRIEAVSRQLIENLHNSGQEED